jgi:serine/threonine protein kinase
MTDKFSSNPYDSDEDDEGSDDLTGCFIGNYKVISPLGSGAFGDVYLGEHPTIESRVAIKVLDPSLSRDPEMVTRFNDEARAVNIIKHPNIIKIYDFGQLPDGRHYFTMEFLEGKELTAIIKEKAPLSLRDTLRISKQLCDGLDAAHGLGIIHRDLKPDNIYVNVIDDKYIVKILDFGIAKLLGGGEKVKRKVSTSVGMVMGTPLFMAPEQAAGSIDEIGPATDIYSLGIILFKMLSNSYPINAKTPRELLFKQVSEPPAKLMDVTKGLPESVCDAIDKTLSKNPTERFQTAGELYEAIRAGAALVSPDLIAEITALDYERNLEDELDDVRKSLTPLDKIEQYKKPKKSGSFLFILIVLLMLGATGTGGYFIWKKVVTMINKGKEPKKTRKAPVKKKIKKPLVVKKPMKAKKLNYSVSVKSSYGGVAVDVYINGELKIKNRKTPFTIKIKKNAFVELNAHRKGYVTQKERFKVDSNIEIVFSAKKRINKRKPRTVVKKKSMRTTNKTIMDKPRPKVKWK